MSTLDLGDIGFEITVDTTKFDAALDSAEKRLQRLGKAAGVDIKIKADTGGVEKVTSTADKAGKKIDEVNRKQIKPAADTKGVDKVGTAVSSASSKVDEINRKSVAPKGDASGIRSLTTALDEVEKKADKTSKSVGEKLTGGIGKTLKASAASVGVAAGGVLATSIGKGMSRLVSIENAEAKLLGLGNSAQTVSGVMENALASVKGTAHGLGEAATTAASMVASGIQPGQQLEQTLKTVGDTAAIAGRNMADVGLIFGSVAARGKLQGDDMLQLMSSGIPVLQLLSKQLGVTSAEVSDMVSEGKIDFETFEKAMREGVGGAALEMGNTFQGALANTGAALGRLGATGLKPFFEVSKNGLNLATKAIDGFEARIKPVSQQVATYIQTTLIPAFASVGEAISKSLAGGQLHDMVAQAQTAFDAVVQAGRTLAPVVVELVQGFGQVSAALGISTWTLFVEALEVAATVVEAFAPALQTVADLMQQHPALVSAAMMAWAGFKTIPGILTSITGALGPHLSSITKLATGVSELRGYYASTGRSISTFGAAMQYIGTNTDGANKTMTRMAQGMANASTQTTFLGKAMGTARVGMIGLSGAASSLTAALGGPIGIAIAATVGAVTTLVSTFKSMNAIVEYSGNVAKITGGAFKDMYADMATGGDGVKVAQEKISAFRTELDKTAAEAPGFWKKAFMGAVEWGGGGVLAGMVSHIGGVNKAFKETTQIAEDAKQAQKAFEELGYSNEQLAAAVAGTSDEYLTMRRELSQMGEAGEGALRYMDTMRDQFIKARQAAAAIPESVKQIAAGMETLGDSAASAESKLSALESVMVAMGLAPQDAERAMMEAAAATDELVESITALELPAETLGDALFDSSGKLDSSNESARQLYDTLNTMRGTLQDVAVNGGDVGAAFESQQPALEMLREQYGLTDEQLQQLIQQYGLVPDTIETLVKVNNEGASGELATIWAQMQQMEAGSTFEIKALTESAKQALDGLGIQYKELKNGNFEITATTDDAQMKLSALSQKLAEVGDTTVSPAVFLDTTQLEYSTSEAQRIIDELDLHDVSAEAQLIIDEFLKNGKIARGDLAYLNELSATPSADLDKTLLDLGVTEASGRVASLNQESATPKVDIDDSGFWSKAGRIAGQLSAFANPITTVIEVVRRTRGRADGGVAGHANGGILPRYATGGEHGGYRLPTTGPGTNMVDGILARSPRTGIPTAWVDAGEWIINRKSSKKYDELLHSINADNEAGMLRSMLKAIGLEKYADGGTVHGSQYVKDQLASMNGTQYVMGGWSSSGTDCSGAVSMAVNAAEGLGIFDSRMSTVTIGQWLSDKGFKRGQGSEGDLRVGWWDQGGGQNGHTAAQLGDGTFIESGGNTGGGLTIGGAAGPLSGRGFTDFMYKPMPESDGDGEYPGDGGVSTGGSGSTSRSTAKSSRGGGGGGGSHSHTSVSLKNGTAAAAQAMGISTSVGSALGSSPQAKMMGAAAHNVGLGGAWDAMMNASIGKMGELLLVTEETVAAFNELGDARAEEANALEAIVEAEKNLAEARANGGVDSKAVEAVQKKEEALAKAREKGDPDKIARAEEELQEAREKARAEGANGANTIQQAENELKQARDRHAASVGRVKGAEAQYYASLVAAPFQQLQTIFSGLGQLAGSIGSMYQQMADRERKKLEQAREGLQVWQQQIDAQKALQDAMEASTAATREHSSQKWRSDLAVSDAEWELTMHRKRTQKELADAHLFAADASEIQAKATRRGAVLEAQVAYEKAKRDLEMYERQVQMSVTAMDMEQAQKLANIQMTKFAMISGALAEIQRSLNVEGMKELEIKAMKAQGTSAVLGGVGGVVGGIASIIGAIGMAAVNPIGALTMGMGGLSGIAQGIGGVMAGRAQIEAANEQQRQLEAAKQRIAEGKAPDFMGLSGKTLEELELKEQQLIAEHKKASLERQKESSAQLEVLRQLLDNAEKNLEYAKRDESRANDLESLMEDANTASATAFFQLGGAGWDGGHATRAYTPTMDGGFAGLSNGRIGAGASLRMEGDDSAAAAVHEVTQGRSADPAVAGAAAAVVSARETGAIRVQMGQLLQLAARITQAVEEADRDGGSVINGSVFNAPVTLQGGSSGSEYGRELAAALAVRG